MSPRYNPQVIIYLLVSFTMVVLILELQVNFASIVGASTDQFSSSSYGIAVLVFAISSLALACVSWNLIDPKGPAVVVAFGSPRRERLGDPRDRSGI